ncbi:hypothetical protein UlMin_028393 [Ulmus minor]
METEITLVFSSNSQTSSPTSSSQSSSSSSNPRKKYDVFFNFHGEDTRKTLLSHLREALKLKGIESFIDDADLEKGRYISPQLLQAIEDSTCVVIIFSENYASSTWCLDELVIITDCMKNKGQVVIPLFYHVDPSDIRKQTGDFGAVFAKHKENLREDIERVQRWRDALTNVTGVVGLDLRNYRDEANFIRNIVEEVSRKVSTPTLVSSAQNPNKHYHSSVSAVFSFVVPYLLVFIFVVIPLFFLFMTKTQPSYSNS